MSGGVNPIRSGLSHGDGGMSTQVGGCIWFVTFTLNVWRDPAANHYQSFVPGNRVGGKASYSDTRSSGFLKAWGKNVGNVPMISCGQLSSVFGQCTDIFIELILLVLGF